MEAVFRGRGKRLPVLLILFLFAFPAFTSGRQEGDREKTAEEPAEILVSAAASLTDCMEEIRDMYTARRPEIKIIFNFGASGTLQRQIEQGAPADIFFSASTVQMRLLQEKGFMDDRTVGFFLENEIVLISPRGGESLSSFEDLAGFRVEKAGMGTPASVPAGEYAQEVLIGLGLLDRIKSKIVLARDVREVLFWVESGNVQAGIVYLTDALTSARVKVCAAAPAGSHSPVLYPAGVLKESRHKEEAEEFLRFLRSGEAEKIFEKYGFGKPE